MLFNTATGYALRALAAMPEDGSHCFSKDLASRLDLPAPYLAKILQSLVQATILESVRAPRVASGSRDPLIESLWVKWSQLSKAPILWMAASWVSRSVAVTIPVHFTMPGAP